jgi:cytochrome oxidase Cu insertion factor (SCO1/SenC/PrrC family)
MNKLKALKPIILIILAAILFSCKNEKTFTITGEIQGVKDTVIYLEKRELTSINIIDSAKVDSSGKFEFTSPAPEYPELYALKLGNQYINIGIDSTETISVKASLKNFATDYTIEGSESNVQIKDITLRNYSTSNAIDKLSKDLETKSITEEVFLDSATSIINDYKMYVINIIVKNPRSLASYYGLFQKINDALLIDPYDKKESRIYGAVATQWDSYFPESARAKHLKNFTLTAMKTQKGIETQNKLLENMPLTETYMLDISLPDLNNKKVSLKDYKGKVIVLDFISYISPTSPAHNSQLNQVYEKYGSNIVIYQVSFDPDAHTWKNAAGNLPWICVRDEQSTDSQLINKYNIQNLPTTYIIDKEGSIVKRLSPEDKLETEISKVL